MQALCPQGSTCLLQQPGSVHVELAAALNDVHGSVLAPGLVQDLTPQEHWDLWACRKTFLVGLEVKIK